LFTEDDAHFILDLFNARLDGQKLALLYDMAIASVELSKIVNKFQPLFTQ